MIPLAMGNIARRLLLYTVIGLEVLTLSLRLTFEVAGNTFSNAAAFISNSLMNSLIGKCTAFNHTAALFSHWYCIDVLQSQRT